VGAVSWTVAIVGPVYVVVADTYAALGVTAVSVT
jgi:hypothetical protein